MKIINHVHGMKDVFFGDGWYDWVRIRTKKQPGCKVEIFYVTGSIPFTKFVALAILEEVNKDHATN